MTENELIGDLFDEDGELKPITMTFRKLGKDEEAKFRQWARENYVINSPIQGYWHPVVQQECAKMNDEASEYEKKRRTGGD